MSKKASSEEKHSELIQVTLNPDQIIKQLSQLRYDKLAEFLNHLGSQLMRDSIADDGRGRPKLAKQLAEACDKLHKAGEKIHKAWKICEPFEKK